MKKLFKIMFFVALALLLISVVLVIASVIFAENNHTGSVGIIGGADGPTAIMVTRTLIFENPTFWIFGVITVLLVASAIGWLATRKK